MRHARYVRVRLSRELAANLDQVMLRLGYRSRDEVVDDAVRRFVESLGLLPEE